MAENAAGTADGTLPDVDYGGSPDAMPEPIEDPRDNTMREMQEEMLALKRQGTALQNDRARKDATIDVHRSRVRRRGADGRVERDGGRAEQIRHGRKRKWTTGRRRAPTQAWALCTARRPRASARKRRRRNKKKKEKKKNNEKKKKEEAWRGCKPQRPGETNQVVIKGGDLYPSDGLREITTEEDNQLEYEQIMFDKKGFQEWAAKLRWAGGTDTMSFATPRHIAESKSASFEYAQEDVGDAEGVLGTGHRCDAAHLRDDGTREAAR